MDSGKVRVESRNKKELLQEISRLRSQLEAAQETLNAIRKGEVDALVVSGKDGEQVFTLRGEQEPYRIFVEAMNEGAAMVDPDGTIVYSNSRFADMVKTPLESVIGSSFQKYVPQREGPILERFQQDSGTAGYRQECELLASNGGLVPVHLSVRAMKVGDIPSLCIVATDLTDRKLAEEKVLQSEQQLRLIFDQIPAAVWTTDTELRIVSGSGASRAGDENGARSFIGKTMQEFFGTQDKSSPPLAAHLAALKGEQGSYEYSLDGNIMSVNVQPLRDSDGAINGVIGVALDVTARKLAEERARQNEEQLRLIFRQIPAIIWTTDRDLRIVSGSGAGGAAANCPAEDLVGKTIQEFFGTQDKQYPPLAAHIAALKGEQRSYEYNLNGTILSVNVQPLRDADSTISGVVGIALDVTENKRSLASVAKLAAIVESTQDAIYGATLSGYITNWNRGAEQLYGYTANEVIGEHVSIIVPEDRQHEPVHVLDQLKGDEIIRPFETVRRRKDGSLIDVSITISTVKDDKGRLIGVSAIGHDLSDRKEVEKELRKLSARLLKLQDEARRDMARELHDSVIQGLAAAVINLSMLKETAQLPPESLKMLEEALKITEDSVREIRTFSYLLHPPLLDAMGLQSALRWFVEGYSKRSGFQVELDLPEGHERMDKEVELTLFRIVQEALTNIQRHSGGHRAKICIRQANGDLTLTISDDGHGMDAQTLEKVRREGATLGVGIAGMKERIRQLGGWLDIASSDKGTSVMVSLPNARWAR